MNRLLSLSIAFAVIAFAPVAKGAYIDLSCITGASDDLGGGWWYSPKLGIYYVTNAANNYTYIYHNELGWMLVNQANSGCSFSLYSSALGHVEYDASATPHESQWSDFLYLYAYDNQEWLAYYRGTAPVCYFWDYADDAFTVRYISHPSPPQSPHGPTPHWWRSFGVLASNRLPEPNGVMAVGQLKHLLVKSYDYIAASLPHEPDVVQELGSDLQPVFNSARGDDENRVNFEIAQHWLLKESSEVVYDALDDSGFNIALMFQQKEMTIGGNRPWTSATNDDNDLAPLQLGQAKLALAIELDLDSDGLLDNWEGAQLQKVRSYTMSDLLSVSTNGDTDNDGLDNLTEYLLETALYQDNDGDLLLDAFEAIAGSSDGQFSSRSDIDHMRSYSELQWSTASGGPVILIPDRGAHEVNPADLELIGMGQ